MDCPQRGLACQIGTRHGHVSEKRVGLGRSSMSNSGSMGDAHLNELELEGWNRGSKQELCLIGSSVPEVRPGKRLSKERGWEEDAFEEEGGREAGLCFPGRGERRA